MAKRANRQTRNGNGGGNGGTGPMGDYRHTAARRKNNPPAKIAAEGVVPAIPKAQYSYDPHLPPVLRFDPNGGPDALPELLAKARTEPLSEEEIELLAEALRQQEPWLEWTTKRERKSFEVDPVALHIHERVSAQAILKIAARQDVQRSLFADPQQEYHQAVQFYRHDVEWANRLILGDSLQVMSSLARREDLAGKVQMIYIDPPYGIKFASNFQPEVGKRDVKDKEQDLTREPEMVRAYRDTWHLGIHSYLSYLRDRLTVARELLADTGSIFVQISDENLHLVRNLLDDIFGREQFIAQITYVKTSSQTSRYVPGNADFILWYGRDRERTKFRRLFAPKILGQSASDAYKYVELPNGSRQAPASENELSTAIAEGAKCYSLGDLTSQRQGRPSGPGTAMHYPMQVEGQTFMPLGQRGWTTTKEGNARLYGAGRIVRRGSFVSLVRYVDDFGGIEITATWTDTGGVGERLYTVQTNTTAIQRCMLMTTDPGDLVLDPTCGSGTTAHVAEQWGRRWITIDTSRVAVAIARQRLLTAKYEFFKLRALNGEDQTRNPNGTWLREPDDPQKEPRTFLCKTVPHITLKSIAQNVALDPIFARHEPILEQALKQCNSALAKVSKDQRWELEKKLAAKEREQGKRSITDADRRRWLLPKSGTEWEHWQVPFDTDPLWPKPLQDVVTQYRKAWRAKMDEVNACIAASAEQEELVDQPEVVRNVVRVSGPFTVEAVQPPEMLLGDNIDPHTGAEQDTPGLFDGEPEELPDGFEPRTLRVVEVRNNLEAANVAAYLDQMYKFLKADGVRFLNNKQMRWLRLEPLFESGRAGGFHAEGRWVPMGGSDGDGDSPNNVAVVFGPQYGPVSAKMVEEAISAANRAGYDNLVVAGFNFDGAATGILSETEGVVPGRGKHELRVHYAHVRPDINPGMNGLLKESPQPGAGQLFTVFGLPRISVDGPDDVGQYTVSMEGVDIYNPVLDEVRSSKADKVAAWFLDGDYDGRTFCITQAFFPDPSAWDKLSRALNGKNGVIDADRFAALSGTVSLPFPAGKNKCVAVKVIDPRGNEVMCVQRL